MADLKEMLETAWKLYRSGDYEDPVFTKLRRANYEPAKALFRAMLDDERGPFRLQALTQLQLMKDLSSEGEILAKVRDVVVNDPDELVRAGAAMLLAAHSRWPEEALQRALKKESDTLTKQEIFLSILQLMTSWDFADARRAAVIGGDVELSIESAQLLAESFPEK